MAIDTQQKRASAVHVSLPWRGLFPLPDAAAETQADRQQAAHHYSGILATGIVFEPNANEEWKIPQGGSLWNTIAGGSRWEIPAGGSAWEVF